MAAITRTLQSRERSGNAELTWGDAVQYDRSMRMRLLTFYHEGHRPLADATLTERKHMHRHTWLVREGFTTTLKSELYSVWDQIGRGTANHEVERTIPQIRFAEATEIIKLPLGLRYIVAREAVVLGQAVQACERINAEWYHVQFATVELPETVRSPGDRSDLRGRLTHYGG